MMTAKQFQANAAQLLLMVDAAGPEGARTGTLYSLLSTGLSLVDFERCVALLVSQEMVTLGANHLITATLLGTGLAKVLNARLDAARKAEALAKAAA